MNSTFKKIVATMSGIGKLPRQIIMHGVQAATGVLVIALLLYFINKNIYNFDYYITFLSYEMASTGLTLFAEAIIGGLVIDYFIKKG
ncbi:MAG: hypothetical protein GX066_04235 [Clostridiaceae bacterium]|nr:hypothetical protein [Clostridiaceae bacterium]